MIGDRVAAVRANLRRYLEGASFAGRPRAGDEPIAADSSLTVGAARAIFEDQVTSREIDVVARELRAQDRGYYTISSAGHEQNAIVGTLLRTTDPALLHYRSGAFVLARSRQDPQTDAVRDTLLSLTAAADDPVAGGRHKVWGSHRLWMLPQTSTIGSHLPKAVGVAFAIERAQRLGMHLPIPDDSIVCCSFGDASVNHATALAGLNAARYAHRLGSPVPILFLCEDNRLGISVRTPPRWIRSTIGGLEHLRYVRARGDLTEIWATVAEAIRTCRRTRAPTFVHLDTVRLWGHAGSDVEAGYRDRAQIAADEERDPLLANARTLVESGAADPAELLDLLERVTVTVRAAAEAAVERPHLASREEVMAPLVDHDDDAARHDAVGSAAVDQRRRHFGDRLPEEATAPTRRTLGALLNATLHDEMLRRPRMLVFGEDVGRKGGVYHLTAGLQAAFGTGRVFDTLLDETTILGIAQGAAQLGFLPVPEIQYLAYVHNALDQLRGEAGSTAFFSAGAVRNPMVVRIASFAYQRGFGGHFHNDNAIAALREIPGIVLAAPSRAADGPQLLRGALGVASASGRVVCFLEPIALYHERDLYEDGDGGWLGDYPPPGTAMLPGTVGVHHTEADDLLIVSYANGLRMSLRAARRLADEGVHARVVDLRWLAPLPIEAVRVHAEACGRVLVADECRASGGVADALVAGLAEAGFSGPLAAVRSADSYVPLGPAAATVLLGEDEILAAARELVATGPSDHGANGP